ncbi:MAG TPA: hypothetical protein VE974_03370 [Thermoanaerobaculia bacterium]|nr:hypothetical protein [Thermoanaerobaculia bacterium]
MFIKKLTIAAAMTLCAAGAYASNFRGGDQVYIPAAAHFQGAAGTFISDVYISNLDDEPVTVTVIYMALGSSPTPGQPAGTEFKDIIQLRAFERKAFPDFFRSGLNLQGDRFGQLIFNACRQGQNCGPETQDEEGYSIHFRPISVESRVYQVLNGRPNETTGQLFTGYPWYSFVSELQSNVELDKVFITGIENTGTVGQPGTFRTNIGVTNASEYSSTTIVLRLYQETLANFKQEKQIQLPPLGSTQAGLGDLFPGVALGTNYFVTVEQRDSQPYPGIEVPETCERGCPAFLAYGSVLDNVTGDATTLEPQFMKELSEAVLEELYPPAAGKKPIRRAIRH